MSAGLVPLFTSAPRIMLRINGTPVAFAIGFNMNISVDVQPIQTIGKFGTLSLEPTMYNVVTGTIQIVKLISGTTKTEQGVAAFNTTSTIFPTNTVTSSIVEENGDVTTITTQTVAAKSLADSSSIAQLEALNMHLHPGKVLFSRTFDMDLYLKVPTKDNFTGTKFTNTTANEGLELSAWLRIEKCRLTSRNVNISIGQLVNEPVNFQGLLASPMKEEGDTDTQLWNLDTVVKDNP